jgi:hypothetical protein
MKKYLDFNGKPICFSLIDGQYWVAIKPICDAVGVNYNRQFQNIKSDPILGQLFAKQQMVGADERLRNMVSLPERFVYGWIFSLQSKSEALITYKLKCYNLLYDYFHGTLTQRQELLSRKNSNAHRMARLRDQLGAVEAYHELRSTEREQDHINERLKSLDKQLASGQLGLFLEK